MRTCQFHGVELPLRGTTYTLFYLPSSSRELMQLSWCEALKTPYTCCILRFIGFFVVCNEAYKQFVSDVELVRCVCKSVACNDLMKMESTAESETVKITKNYQNTVILMIRTL